MKIIAEVSKPHYHPDRSFQQPLTKKRDLSIPPNWVANEKIKIGDKEYPIIMPARDKELIEDNQEAHIHFPQYLTIKVNGVAMRAKVKVHKEMFDPRVHFDHIDGELLKVVSGHTVVEL